MDVFVRAFLDQEIGCLPGFAVVGAEVQIRQFSPACFIPDIAILANDKRLVRCLGHGVVVTKEAL